jgi:hypothetical protein
MHYKTTLRKLSYTLFCVSVTLLTACKSTDSSQREQTESEWDFDHQVQFYKTQFDDYHFQLEVIANHKVRFDRLSAFLLRRSYLICAGYGYKLEILKGVESFDHRKASPNLITSNLTAKLECPAKQ